MSLQIELQSMLDGFKTKGELESILNGMVTTKEIGNQNELDNAMQGMLSIYNVDDEEATKIFNSIVKKFKLKK